MTTSRSEMQAFPLRLSEEENTAVRTFASVTNTSVNDVIRRCVREFVAGQGGREEFDAMLANAREQYAVALDKLADM